MRPPNPGDDPWAIERLVGSQLRRRRLFLELTQDELGALVGVTFDQIQRYELGAERIQPALLLRLCRLLGASVSYFFGNESSDSRRRARRRIDA